MKLFFETALQAKVFLFALPIGLGLGLCLDIGGMFGKMKPAADILSMLLASLALVILVMYSMENGLQIYHLLAVLVGIFLYIYGIGRLIRAIRFRFRNSSLSKRKEKQKKETPSDASK